MKFKNSTILITGGSRGIGLALAKALSHNNNKIIICGRDQSNLQAAGNLLPNCIIIPCDISKQTDRDRLIKTLEQQYAEINVLINNAAIQQALDFSHAPIDDQAIENEININLSAQIVLTNQLLPLLLNPSKRSHLIFLGSALAQVPKYSAPIYSASKAAIHNFCLSLRQQLKPDNITVVEVIPDLVDTAMTKHQIGVKKMSSDDLAKKILKELQKNKAEIRIGRIKLLNFINRLSQNLAQAIINKNN